MSIISGITPSGAGGTVETVSFGPVATSDAALKAAGVHLPLELNAQEFYTLARKRRVTESRASTRKGYAVSLTSPGVLPLKAEGCGTQTSLVG